jgi:hypothetical protein
MALIPNNLELFKQVKRDALDLTTNSTINKEKWVKNNFVKRGGKFIERVEPVKFKISKLNNILPAEIEPELTKYKDELLHLVQGYKNMPTFGGFIERKTKDFNEEVQDIFNFLSVRGKYTIIGSSANTEMLYNSDYDLQTDGRVSLNTIKNIFKNKFKEAEQDPDIFIVDFKCGEYKKEPVRWNKTNIKKEYQIIDGERITLDECLLMKSTIKMDVIALINGVFAEFSDNYYLSINGMKNYEEFTDEEVKKELIESAKEEYKDNNLFKYLKRVYSVFNLESGKKREQEELIKFFNSTTGLINKNKNELEIILRLLEENKFRKPKQADVCNNLQIVKQSISGLTERNLSNVFDVLCSKTGTILIKGIKKVIDYLQEIINKETNLFLSENKNLIII